jgi:hypothetical protein
VASVVRRKRRDGTVRYKAQWHAGGTRDGAWQLEALDDRRAAAKFQAKVEANG